MRAKMRTKVCSKMRRQVRAKMRTEMCRKVRPKEIIVAWL
jgi:hypothetical protein